MSNVVQNLPALRDDLDIFPAERSKTGARLWSIYDQIRNKFFRISWLEFEILSYWSMGDPKKIIQRIEQRTTLKPTDADIMRVYQFLLQHELLDATSPEMVKHLLQSKGQKPTGLNRLLKSYLFFRIPLVKPDYFLKKISPKMTWLFTRNFVIAIMTCMILGAFLVLREFQSFISAFSVVQSPTGALMVIFVLAFAKIIHELGHGIACRHYGCRVPNMGVAFIVLWPILWTDTTDAWRLTDHKKRLIIDSGGMIAELSLAAISSILWALSPDGDFKTAMHLLAGTTWIMTLFINLNPFMRFDGYYIASDLFNIPNLQSRSFTLARQFIRKTLLGVPPLESENFTEKERFFLILYAFGTWIYRFFLFLGIALVVYHFFFKALGVSLMVVEIWWFIIKPVVMELKQWGGLIKMIKSKKRFYITLLGLFLILGALMMPLNRNISVPAILKSGSETPIMSVIDAQLFARYVSSGDSVKKGQLLFSFRSPEIDHERKIIEINLKQEEQEYAQAQISNKHYGQAILLKHNITRNKLRLYALDEEAQKLNIYAPNDGYIFDVPEHLQKGSWVSPHEFLSVFSDGKTQITAYVEEKNIERINTKVVAEFYPRNHHKGSIEIMLDVIGSTSIHQLHDLDLASIYGGAIKVKNEGDGTIPVKVLYAITLSPSKPSIESHTHRISGYVSLPVSPESFLGQAYRKTISIFIREFGG